MPRIQDLQPSFSAGELTPRLAARLDFQKYRSGLDTSENFVLLAEGGAMRRSGSRYIAEEEDSAVKGRLKKFQFSTVQAYMLEMGDQKLRFYRHQAQITVADTDAAVTNGTFDSSITGWDNRSTGAGSIAHDAVNLDLNLIPGGATASDIGWAEQDITTTNTGQEHVLKFKVIGTPGDKIEFQVGTSSTGVEILAAVEKEVGYHCVAFTPSASPFYIQFRNLGTNANKTISIDDVSLIDNSGVEIDTLWPEAVLFDVEGPQSADELYGFHELYPTHKLQRFGHTTWSLVEVAWQDGPYLDMNETTTTLTPSATSGVAVTLTASATVGINGGDGFKTTDVNRLVRLDNPASGEDWGWGIIVGFTSTTVVTVHVKEAFAATTADTRWRLGSWSETTGYPQAASFFEQRLYVGGTSDQPQTFWASQTADFVNFRPDDGAGTIEADDALDFTLSADNVNAIRWISAGEDTLAIGTEGGEWIPTANGLVITPLDITVRRQTTHGSARMQPVRIGSAALFLQRAKRKIREFIFSWETEGFVAADLTRLAQHISRGGIVEMAYAEERDSVVWAVREDGQLLSMTFRRDEGVVGWGRHILGGSFSAGDAVVESVAVIPGDDGAGQFHDSTDRDEVWLTVKRTINGATKRYVEMLERDFETGDDQEDSYYSDSLITYNGAAATTITGLDHLEGEAVKVLADGAIVTGKTVTSGQIELDVAATPVHIGLGYAHKLKTLKITAGNPAGTTLGKKHRIYGLTFSLLNSHTLEYGPDVDLLTAIDFRTVADALDSATPLFTGDQFVAFPGDWTRDGRIVIESDDPVPFTLLALAPETQVNALK
jgi:hypothetical protein